MVCIICFQVQYCKDSENPVLYNPHTGMVSLYNGNMMSLWKVFMYYTICPQCRFQVLYTLPLQGSIFILMLCKIQFSTRKVILGIGK